MIVSSEFQLFEAQNDGRRHVLEKFVTDTGEIFQRIYLAEPDQDYMQHLAQAQSALEESLAESEINQLLNES